MSQKTPSEDNTRATTTTMVVVHIARDVMIVWKIEITW